MHELSLCMALVEQLEALARQHRARCIDVVELDVGQLSGAQADLLRTAFRFAREGTVAAAARLVTRDVPPRVACDDCGAQASAPPNDLRCPRCGGVRTRVVDGDRLTLARVEFSVDDGAVAAG